mmetsp:Transcript_18466/g.37474  ORF Transcript_18466/g.37474 Transcript_18466/m.37474 type:complete len:116 (+) Transcript_18466:1377-1724(+)
MQYSLKLTKAEHWTRIQRRLRLKGGGGERERQRERERRTTTLESVAGGSVYVVNTETSGEEGKLFVGGSIEHVVSMHWRRHGIRDRCGFSVDCLYFKRLLSCSYPVQWSNLNLDL